MHSRGLGRSVRPLLNRVTADVLFGAWRWAGGLAGTAGHRSRHARRFGAVGEGTAFAFPPGASMGERWIRVGARTLVGPDVVLSAGMWPDEALDVPRGWVISIGQGCSIGRGSSFIGRVGIEVGDDVTIAPGVYVTDHNHDYAHPRVPIGHQWVVEAPVRIGSGSWLGVGAVVLPGADIGEHVAVAAGSVVRGRIPDRSVVAGAPARVVRRWDEAAGAWDPPLPDGREIGIAPPGWLPDVPLDSQEPEVR